MYLLDKQTFIRQILPPHWRDGYRETMLLALLTPVFSVYNRFVAYKDSAVVDINMSAQVLVLDAAIKRLSSPYSYVVDTNDFSFEVFLPENLNKNAKTEIIELLNTYKPTGVNFKIKTFKT